MAKLVIVKNPFQPWNGREIKTIPQGFTVREAINLTEFKGLEIHCIVDGNTVVAQDSYIIPNDSIITICPVIGKGGGGKSILGVVAAVALSVVSMGVGNMVAAQSWAAFSGTTAAWTTGAYLAAAAVMFVGSSLVGRFIGTANIDTNLGDYSTDATYSWTGVQTTEGQNNPITMTYGKVKSAGQSIGKFVNVTDNKEYLNWLISAGEGPLEISNIQINDNAVENFENVKVEIRNGTNNQEVISNFNDTYFSKNLGYQLLDDYRTDTCQGNATQGIILKVEFSNGLYYANDNGGLSKAWVDLYAEYKEKNSDVWNEFFNTRIEGSQSSSLRKEYRVDDLPAGEYEVRIKVTKRSHDINSSRASVRCYWTSITSIVYDDFTYPNIALIGIKALATDQLSGAPSLSFTKEREYVYVWNPNTNQYEQRAANNPAWAAYDMLHLAGYLLDVRTNNYEYEVRGVPAKHLIYEQFEEWANFCDDKKLYVNVEITQASEMLDCINSNIANCGRGMVIRYGTRYGCVYESVKQPVQMFNMANIMPGTFSEEFLPTNDRANCVEITYNDAEQDYSRNTITIYGETYDTDAEEKTAQATYNGITSYEQAYREGMYQLYCNKYQLRTVSFEANIDSIACTVGDVIVVSHDVPMWANSGRIDSIDYENREMLLPTEIDNIEGNYRIMYRTLNDNIYLSDIVIISNADGWCRVRLLSDFNADDLPQANDIFDIAKQNLGSKPFVVKNITRAQDFTRRIECLEYNENIYNENYDIPPIQYSVELNNQPQNVTGLIGKQTTFKNEAGVAKSLLSISWNIPDNGGRFTILISKDNVKYKMLVSGIQGVLYETEVEYGNDYYVKVITTLGVAQSNGVVYGPIEVGYDEIPPDVTYLDTELLANGTRRYWWEFEYPKPNDIAGFKFKFIQGNRPDWSLANDMQEGLVTHQPYEAQTVMQGVHCIMIKAVDNAGNESDEFASCVVNFGEPLRDNVLWESSFLDDIIKIDTNGEIVNNSYIRSRQNNAFWNNPLYSHYESKDSYYWNESYDDFYCETYFTCVASGNFYLIYDVEGIYNITYYIEGREELPKAYSTKVRVKAGDKIHVRLEAKSGVTRTVLRKLVGIIDVPDRQEHFENITINASGTQLPIRTPNYHTITVAVDSISTTGLSGSFELEIIQRNPCIVRFVRTLNGVKEAVTLNADITWQGYEKEII